MLDDCHTHLDQYAPQELDSILKRAQEAGVDRILSAGITLDSSSRCIQLANQYPQVFAGVGIHPMEIRKPWSEATYGALRRLALSSPRVVAISEVGLDYLPDMPDKHIQETYLREQVRLARELGLPVIYHSREAYPQILDLLKEERVEEVGVVAHYFQGDERIALRCLDQGFYISLAKPLLRLPQLQEVVKKLPLERLVLETDSFPQPWKKKRLNWTEPAHVRQVAEKVAELKGVSLEEVALQTRKNLEGILGGRFAGFQKVVDS